MALMFFFCRILSIPPYYSKVLSIVGTEASFKLGNIWWEQRLVSLRSVRTWQRRVDDTRRFNRVQDDHYNVIFSQDILLNSRN